VAGQVPVILVEDFEKQEARGRQSARRLSDEIRPGRLSSLTRAEAGDRNPVSVIPMSLRMQASRHRSMTLQIPPFTSVDGELPRPPSSGSQGGADTDMNTVALCPNCHRRMHILDLEDDRRKLQERVRQS
jgi:hypothetical protein